MKTDKNKNTKKEKNIPPKSRDLEDFAKIYYSDDKIKFRDHDGNIRGVNERPMNEAH